jgi:hypothetical protein
MSTSGLRTFKMRLPEVIRSKKTLAVSNPTPKNERPPKWVDPGNTFRLNSRFPATSKYSIFVLWSYVVLYSKSLLSRIGRSLFTAGIVLWVPTTRTEILGASLSTERGLQINIWA